MGKVCVGRDPGGWRGHSVCDNLPKPWMADLLCFIAHKDDLCCQNIKRQSKSRKIFDLRTQISFNNE